MLAFAVGNNWPPHEMAENSSNTQRSYKQYRGVLDNDGGFAGDFPAEVVEDLDDVSGQEELSEAGCSTSFSCNDRSVTVTALQQPSKTVLTSIFKVADVI